MAIQSLIFHKITRWQEDQPAEITLSEAAPSATADHEALFSQLKKVFQFKAGKLHGRFDSDYSAAPFQSWLKEYLDNKISLEKLSLLYMNQLKELVDKTSEEFEGNILLIHEDRADGPRLYAFVVETTSGMLLNTEQQLDVVDYLNANKLDLALRIDLDEWLNGEDSEDPYLVLVKARSKAKNGEAFALSLGFKSNIDTAKETETLMEVLANYTKEAEPKQAAQIHQKAYDFCVEQQQLGEAVPVNELSGFLDENEPTKFSSYIEENANIESSSALRPDTRKLKHLVRISGKGNGLSLSFSSDLMQQTILFDEKSDTLTITEIPKSLKKQILEHIKTKNED